MFVFVLVKFIVGFDMSYVYSSVIRGVMLKFAIYGPPASGRMRNPKLKFLAVSVSL